MGILGKFIERMAYRGGILAAGLVCVFLSKKQYFPLYMGPVSYGITSLGVIGVLTYYLKEKETDDDPDRESRMAEFRRIKPQLEMAIREQALLLAEYQSTLQMPNIKERFEADSRKFEDYLRRRDPNRVAEAKQLDIAEGTAYQTKNEQIQAEQQCPTGGHESMMAEFQRKKSKLEMTLRDRTLLVSEFQRTLHMPDNNERFEAESRKFEDYMRGRDPNRVAEAKQSAATEGTPHQTEVGQLQAEQQCSAGGCNQSAEGSVSSNSK